MNADLPVHPVHLYEMMRDLADRVLLLEAGFPAPLSAADRIIAQGLDEQRRAESKSFPGRLKALNRAIVEGERTGTHEPIDDIVRRLKRGDFDRPSKVDE
jgi:hypothetical protein